LIFWRTKIESSNLKLRDFYRFYNVRGSF